MPTHLRKVRKFRGSRSHGCGQVGQHRGAGRRGGRGQTGGHKHHWTRTITQDQGHFGKLGFKRPWVYEPATINIGILEEITDLLIKNNLALKEKDGIHINLVALGIGKLLGAGKIEKKFILKAAACSEAAKQKVENAKGKIELVKG